MNAHVRRGFGAIDLVVVLAIVGVIVGVLMSGVQRARDAARRVEASNNLKQLGIACHVYHDANNVFPLGNDTKKKNQSAFVALLPFVEQANLKVDEKNVPLVKLFLDPRDSAAADHNGIAGSNFLFCAGSEPGLDNNNGPCPQDGKGVALAAIANGSSNTMLIGTTLRGDGGKKAVDVQRQHVALKKEALKGIADTAGVQDFKDDKNIAGNRCFNWSDGHFLQGTFTATRAINDEAPDVDCEGTGGLSALRSFGPTLPILYCDAHVSNIPKSTSLATLKKMANCSNKEAFIAP
jgi:type II secretory pathway pseudopilin PulG